MPRLSDKDILLKAIPENGEAIGNFTLKGKVKWDDEKYWRVRDELINEGLISIGKGKGGSVYQVQALNEKLVQKVSSVYKKEKDLYKPFLRVIDDSFVKDKNIKNYISQVTANQGQKNTGGKWSRPDVVIISVNTYSYLPGKFFDIISFELKMDADFNVAGVFEAAAHSKFATKSYYVAYLPNDWNSDIPEYERIKSECERFGIGLIYFTDPQKYETYEILVEPKRRSPDPMDMDQFISIQIEDENKEKINEFLQ